VIHNLLGHRLPHKKSRNVGNLHDELLFFEKGNLAEILAVTATVKGCRMSALTRCTNECSRPFRADVGQPLQGGNRVGCRYTQISVQAMGI